MKYLNVSRFGVIFSFSRELPMGFKVSQSVSDRLVDPLGPTNYLDACYEGGGKSPWEGNRMGPKNVV